MKKTLLKALLALGLSTGALAANPATEGTYTAPSSETLDMSRDYSFALGAAVDYGFGVTMQFKKLIDLSVGTSGVGADFLFFRYQMMPKSKFFSRKPLSFYVGAGAGYVWDDKYAGLRKGAVIRAPIGADWQFAQKWSVYLSVSPTVNFQKAYTKNNVTTDRDTDFLVMGTVGIRFLF